MTIRRIQTHEACLKSFAREFKREVKQNLRFWQRLDPKEAVGRRMAYANVLALLQREAEEHGIPLVDLGLADYEIPKLEKSPK